MNMVTFFRDMSHGVLDLSGSQVFGWYTLDKKRSEYVGSGAKEGQQGRKDLITWARQAAIADNKDLNKFFSVVVCMNVQTDLYGGPYGVVCDDGRDRDNGMSSLSPSLLGQEMGHAYGLFHSRADGSTEDSKDEWDVMSTKVGLHGSSSTFHGVGRTCKSPLPHGSRLKRSPIWQTSDGLMRRGYGNRLPNHLTL